MPFNTAAALERIKSKSLEPAIPAIPAICQENQRDDVANRLLIGCYSEAGPVETEILAPAEASFPSLQPPITTQVPPTNVVGMPLSHERGAKASVPPRHPNPVRHLMDLLEGDLEAYADALRRHGPMTYGMAMDALGWGATRAGKAEQALRRAGRITFNSQGRAVLVENGGDHDA